ncbi:MAG: D-glycero-beta-D-manno-heptose-7-phosphate kinase [Bacteroidetes bacterium]|jgi:D-glycero-beta-D-manno-heptose-7-phosphate kinase|nr:D-glycero-beta-D-manno-heptose-7-phosphate kinase [Bacteroidota bacterium]
MMIESELNNFFERLPGIRALVLGDVMIDRYSYVRQERMSPEAPVPVWDVEHRDSRLGGAGHVALNLKSLGCQVRLVGLAGRDADGIVLQRLMHELNLDDQFIISSPSRRTTLKHRIINRNTHLARIDEEDTRDADLMEEELLKAGLISAFEDVDVLILQDYNKGVLSEAVIRFALKLAHDRSIPVAVDPKKRNFFAYTDVNLFKPNHKELCEAMNRVVSKKDHAGLFSLMDDCRKRISAHSILLTLSEEGILFDQEHVHGHLPAQSMEVVDVSGAGDTVIAVAACALALNLPIKNIAALSNLAGGLACTQAGVRPVSHQSLRIAAQHLTLSVHN